MGSITRGIANNILGSGAVDATDGLSGTIPANNIANASLSNLTAFPPSVSAGIPQVASDPPSPTEGDVWYNTTTYKLKVRGLSISSGTWASGTSLNTARRGLMGTGTQTAALGAGGWNSPTSFRTITESWNGSTWTEVNDLNTARSNNHHHIGTQTAATLASGGTTPWVSLTSAVENWDGTNWTTGTSVNTARRDSIGGGTQTAALFSGGSTGSVTGATEIWNGSSWTEVNDMNTGRVYAAGVGTSSTAVLNAGGADDTVLLNSVEEWNGTSWTEIADINTSQENRGSSGITTDGILYGGSTGITNTEHWNGTSWTEINDMATAKGQMGASSPSSASAIAFGGNTPAGDTADVQEWTTSVANQNVTLT